MVRPATSVLQGCGSAYLRCLLHLCTLPSFVRQIDDLRPAGRQGGSFAYLTPAFALIAQVQNDTSLNFPTDHDRFVYTMRVLQASRRTRRHMIASLLGLVMCV